VILTDPLTIKSGQTIGTKSSAPKPERKVIMSKAKEKKEQAPTVEAKEAKVMLIGLINGEQVIAKISDDVLEQSFFTVKNPAVLVNAEKGLGMAPWLVWTNAEKQGVVINKSNVVFVSEPRIEIVNQYNAQYGNGLVLPTQSVEAPAPQLTLAT
jgi:hypothetical protein